MEPHHFWSRQGAPTLSSDLAFAGRHMSCSPDGSPVRFPQGNPWPEFWRVKNSPIFRITFFLMLKNCPIFFSWSKFKDSCEVLWKLFELLIAFAEKNGGFFPWAPSNDFSRPHVFDFLWMGRWENPKHPLKTMVKIPLMLSTIPNRWFIGFQPTIHRLTVSKRVPCASITN